MRAGFQLQPLVPWGSPTALTPHRNIMDNPVLPNWLINDGQMVNQSEAEPAYFLF